MTELNKEQFNAELQKDIPLIVDFWAGWCMPCKIFAPVMGEIADELDGKANFGKVDIDEERELAMEHNITSIPTLVIYQGGQEKERMVGIQKKEDVVDAVFKYLKP